MDNGLKFWLFRNNKPLYIDGNNNIQEGDAITLTKPDNQPANLPTHPKGWDNTLVKFGRNTTYLGLFREFSVSLSFVQTAAKILRDAFFRYGFETVIELGISKLNRMVYPLVYENWFLGEIDFSKFNKIKDEVTVNVMEGGLSKYFKANENTVYEIPISTDTQKKVLYLDGVPFKNKVEFIVFENQIVGNDEKYVGMGTTLQEGITQGVLIKDSDYVAAPDTFLVPRFPSENYFLRSFDKNITAIITGNVNAQALFSSNFNLYVEKYNSSTNVRTVYSIYNATLTTTNTNISVNLSIPLAHNESIYMFMYSVGGAYIRGGSLKIEYDVTFTPSFAECLTPFRLCEQIVNKMTGGKYTIKSDFLQTLNDKELVTSGQALRKYGAASVIKTSFKDFFKSYQFYGIGLDIKDNKLVIEKHQYFYEQSDVLYLGEVSDFKLNVAEDLIYNTIKTGYKYNEVDKINGREEFNTTHQYTLPITKIVKELDLVSTYDAGMVPIESTRIDYNGKDTTDSEKDNKVYRLSVAKGVTNYKYYQGYLQCFNQSPTYFLQLPKVLGALSNNTQITIADATANNGNYTLQSTGYVVANHTLLFTVEPITNATTYATITGSNSEWYRLYRPSYTSISGVTFPASVFNTELSPKRCLLNNGAYIHSICDKLEAKDVVFQSAEMNKELQTTLVGVNIVEKANEPIGNLQDKLFLPYYFLFDVNIPVNMIEVLRNSPYKRLSFTYKENTYYGYFSDGQIKPDIIDKQNLKLLAATNNDLTKLIND